MYLGVNKRDDDLLNEAPRRMVVSSTQSPIRLKQNKQSRSKRNRSRRRPRGKRSRSKRKSTRRKRGSLILRNSRRTKSRSRRRSQRRPRMYPMDVCNPGKGVKCGDGDAICLYSGKTGWGECKYID